MASVTLRIQEILQEIGMASSEINKILNVATEAPWLDASNSIEITEETSAELRRIATELKTPVMDLIKLTNNYKAFRLKIFEFAAQKGLSIEELSERSRIHPSILAFYSTQAIPDAKLACEKFLAHLDSISNVLECQVEELKIPSELPMIRLNVEDKIKEKGLSLEDVSLITGTPPEFLELISNQPLEIPASSAKNSGFTTDTTPKELFCYWIETALGKQEICK